MRRVINVLQEFSVPLIAGVLIAIVWANVATESYHNLVHTPVTALWQHGAEHSAEHASPFDHFLTLHFLANDILMVLFFGIAAKEITEACLPGGKLTPISNAVNPLFATVGGVLGPVAVFLGLNALFGSAEWMRGWGIPTATDIALAWLAARLLFGKSHPAVSFLLLLAVADDAIGLGIIAFGYPDPAHPTEWFHLLWLPPAMIYAYSMRQFGVRHWAWYVVPGGVMCWWGLFCAGLHPALALVFIVPFLPAPKRDAGLFVELMEDDGHGHLHAIGHSPLEEFEHSLKSIVDWGLFLFAFANAGVTFSAITGLTWIVLLAMLIGKPLGITAFALLARRLGFPLPTGMSVQDLIVAGTVASLGLTVALFVSSQAFTGDLQAAAKMGSLFSISTVLIAWTTKLFLSAVPAKSESSGPCQEIDVQLAQIPTA